MPEYTECPNCHLTEFTSRSARDVHVHRCKHKTQSISQPSSENKHESSSPKPQELYTRFDGRKAPLTEAELISEGIDWLKSMLTGKKSNSQPEESVRQLTITELAEQRVRELNGEIPSQFESFTPSSYEQQQTQSAVSSPSFHVREAIRSVFSKVFPQKKKEFPLRPVNIYGQSMAHWKCYSCWDWVPDTQIALHQADNHYVEHVW